MDVQAIRSELVALRPDGWAGYDWVPGDANSPAVVAGLPDSITFDASYRLATITLPVYVIVATNDIRAGEAELLEHAVALAQLYRGARGESFTGCRVVVIGEFVTIQIGPTEALSASITLEVHARV